MRLLTVYDVVNQAQLELSISQRAIQTAVTSNDRDILQMVALLSAVADEVVMDEPYKETLGDGIWLKDTAGNPKSSPTADTDVVLFDGRVAVDGLKYKFLQQKGLEYGEVMRDFIVRMNRLAARANARIIDLDTDQGRMI